MMSLRKYFLTACMLFRYREIDNEARSPTRPQTFSLRVFLLSDDGLWRLEARPNRGKKLSGPRVIVVQQAEPGPTRHD